MKKIRPLHDYVLVQRAAADAVTPGGIIVPDNAREKVNQGTVLAVGRGKTLETGKVREPHVKSGDRVLFGKYAGTEFELDGEKNLLLLREDEIHGVVEG